MLEQVMRYLNNRFDERSDGTEVGSASGAFSVEDGTMQVDGLLDGQWFWVEGSVLNDGLHRYPDTDMADEEFEGTVVFLAVPRAVEEIAEQAEAWCSENADAIGGPYQSESFGGYTYSLAGGSAAAGRTQDAAWQSHFGAMLRPWRKLSRDWV